MFDYYVTKSRDHTQQLDRIERLIGSLFSVGGSVMAHLERLTESVRQVNTKADSLITLTHGLAEKIRELKGDETALNQLADELDAQSAELQAAIDANTEPAPTPEEPTE